MHNTLIDAGVLAALAAEDVRIFDCRFDLAVPQAGQARFAAGHIPGAAYVHLDDDLSGPIIPGRTGRHPLPDRDAFRDFLGAHDVRPDRQVVAYDDAGGMVAARLWWMVRWAGHANVAVLDGGYAAWLNGSPERRQARPRRDLPPDSASAVSMADVREHVDDQTWCLVDARANDRFHGRNESIDPKAGHIAGALSAPFQANLGSGGRFLDPASLRQRFETLLGDERRPVVCYCGSGVTAAHNVLAMVHAGLPEPALYVGSWSEWITDADNPTGT